jgi:hypothetical protein
LQRREPGASRCPGFCRCNSAPNNMEKKAVKDIIDTSGIQLDDIAIYAVHESDGTLAGFSFDAQPGTAEQDRVHTPIDRSNPEGALTLIAYGSHAEAVACTEELVFGGSGGTGCVVRTFSDNLTCVLVDFLESASSVLHVEDMRNVLAAGHDGAAS